MWYYGFLGARTSIQSLSLNVMAPIDMVFSGFLLLLCNRTLYMPLKLNYLFSHRPSVLNLLCPSGQFSFQILPSLLKCQSEAARYQTRAKPDVGTHSHARVERLAVNSRVVKSDGDAGPTDRTTALDFVLAYRVGVQ